MARPIDIGIERGDQQVIEADNSGYTVLTVSSGRIFKLETLLLTNRSGYAEVNLYDAASGGPQLLGTSGKPTLRTIIGQTKTEAMGNDFLKGLYFASSIVAWTSVSGTFCYVGGKEL